MSGDAPTLVYLTPADFEAAADALALVLAEPPSAGELRFWSTRDVVEAENWAALEHLRASDCDIPVPSRPAVLDGRL